VIGDLDDDGVTEVAVSAAADGGSIYILTLATPVQECGDSFDNDADGFTDLDDPDCVNVFDTTEVPEPGQALMLAAGIAMLVWLSAKRSSVRAELYRRAP
jgi:hypothetical protein